MLTIDFKEIKTKLSNMISESGWHVVDRYIFSNDFQKTLEFLVNDVNNGKRFTPKVKNFFRAFIECPHDKLKVVFVGQDPYPNLNVADGLAFSCSISQKEQSSLTKIFDELERVYPGYKRDVDLKRWANQGVLLLNRSLSTQINKTEAHYHLWNSFITMILRYINDNFKDIIFVFMGRKAQSFSNLINQHTVLECEHPAAASYNKRDWRCKDVFNKCNSKLKKFSKNEIIW